MALPWRQHIVKNTYFFVGGYLVLTLFMSILEEVLMETEHTPEGKRGLYFSFPRWVQRLAFC
jgi:hypothetical protein